MPALTPSAFLEGSKKIRGEGIQKKEYDDGEPSRLDTEIMEPCKHGFYDDEDCMFCRQEQEKGGGEE